MTGGTRLFPRGLWIRPEFPGVNLKAKVLQAPGGVYSSPPLCPGPRTAQWGCSQDSDVGASTW